jgi:hypothetical protein
VARSSTHVTRNSRALPVPVSTQKNRRKRGHGARFGQLLEDLTFVICVLGLTGTVICAVAALLGYI